MLDNQDIQKLIGVFSTKEEMKEMISGLANRKDLANLVTLKEFDRFQDGMNDNFSKVLTLEEFDYFKRDIKQDINGLRESVQVLTISVDRLVKSVSDLSEEYGMVANKLDRHEKWFQQVADKIGIKLEY